MIEAIRTVGVPDPDLRFDRRPRRRVFATTGLEHDRRIALPGDLRPPVQSESASNAAAAAERDPCVPAPPGATYFNVVTAGTTLPRISAGDHQVIELTGWATDETADWQLYAQSAKPDDAIFTLGTDVLNDGKSTTLDITVPPSTPIGSTLRLFVSSGLSVTNYQRLPMTAVAGLWLRARRPSLRSRSLRVSTDASRSQPPGTWSSERGRQADLGRLPAGL